jgi:hypothetical protein
LHAILQEHDVRRSLVGWGQSLLVQAAVQAVAVGACLMIGRDVPSVCAMQTPVVVPCCFVCAVFAGALLLGDAFNMRHPLTGGGMTVALSDTRLLCEMLQPLPSFEDAIATAHRTAEFYTKRKPVSATINTLANALYKVFCVTGSNAHEEMRQACFDYLALGNTCASGPVSLLSGLNPSPSLLVMHFFSVALFGVGRLLRPRPTFK